MEPGCRMWGQFEIIVNTFISARKSIKLPGFSLPSRNSIVPSGLTAIRVNKLRFGMMSFLPKPHRVRALRKLSREFFQSPGPYFLLLLMALLHPASKS